MRYTLTLAALLCLALPSFAQAQDAPSRALTDAFGASASAEPLTLADVKALAELLRGPAAPVAQPAPAPATVAPAPGPVTSDGVLGLGWGTIAGGVGSLLLFIFGLWKWTGKGRVKGTAQDVVASVWWIIERNFADMPGPVKANLALAELYKALAGKGIPLDPKIGEEAALRWAQMSAQDGLARDRVQPLATPAVDPGKRAAAEAAAVAARDVATPGKSSLDLAREAGAS